MSWINAFCSYCSGKKQIKLLIKEVPCISLKPLIQRVIEKLGGNTKYI